MNLTVVCIKIREPDAYIKVGVLHRASKLVWYLELDEKDWNKLKPYLPKGLQDAVEKYKKG